MKYRSAWLPVAAGLWCAALTAAADTPAPSDAVKLTLLTGAGTVIDCPPAVVRVAASSPEIVDVVTASRHEVILQAKSAGHATVVVWSQSGARTTYEITVEPNLEPMRRLLRETFPSEQIDLRASKDSVALIGHASTQAVADRALTLVAATSKGAISNLQIAPPPPENQILLRVRFAELNRTAVQEFGVNLLSTGALNTPGQISTGQFPAGGVSKLTGIIPGKIAGTTTEFTLSDILNIFAFRPDLNLGAIIRDLQNRNLLQILAEPNLVATSGKEASFLAGGEFPVPVAQGGATVGAISVQYREFGVRLAFLPLLTPNRSIRLHVKPEVSALDFANGVTLAGFKIPALTSRRVETDIELSQGQSFVIGGLLDNRLIENLSQVPGLAQVPLLGALFKSRSETRSQNELIVIVTPETAQPLAAGERVGPLMPQPFLAPPVASPKAKP